MNALCNALFKEIGKAVKDFDADEKIAAIIITGKQKYRVNTYYLYSLYSLIYKFLCSTTIIYN